MFDRPQIQTYAEALEVIASGDATLHATYSDPIPIKNRLDFDHQLYVLFAQIAPTNMQAFICGPFGNWDGTSQGMFYDGLVFALARQPFIGALQHHCDEDGARYIWDFLSAYNGTHVLGPLYEKVNFQYIYWIGGTMTEYATEEEANKMWRSDTPGKRSMSGSYHIRRKTT